MPQVLVGRFTRAGTAVSAFKYLVPITLGSNLFWRSLLDFHEWTYYRNFASFCICDMNLSKIFLQKWLSLDIVRRTYNLKKSPIVFKLLSNKVNFFFKFLWPSQNIWTLIRILIWKLFHPIVLKVDNIWRQCCSHTALLLQQICTSRFFKQCSEKYQMNKISIKSINTCK
jgi:hypothetical protein